MKLLFDENVSERLVSLTADIFPGSQHVTDVGLDETADFRIWEFAAIHAFAIVSKDKDFRDQSIKLGGPPKVISLIMGNCSTARIAEALRVHRAEIEAFGASSATLLILR